MYAMHVPSIGAALQPVLGAVASIPGLRKHPIPVLPPRPFPQQPDDSTADLDAAVSRLKGRADAWVATSPSERVAMLTDCLDAFGAVAPCLAGDCVRAKGSYGNGSGEELCGCLTISMGLRSYMDALSAGAKPLPMATRKSGNGQTVAQIVAQVFPQGLSGLLFGGFCGEVWIEPGKEATQGHLYREKATGKKKDGAVSLVLGAGNQVCVAIMDVLHKLLVDDEVVLLKLNPVMDYVGPHILKLFAPFVDRGFLLNAYGGRDVGEYLTAHTGIHSVHLTGSEATFNSIVWGSPTAKRTGTPKCTKEVTAELGCITPCVVVPPPAGSPWTKEEIQHNVSQVVAGLLMNCGHNCLALEVLVTSADWPQRSEFISALKERLASMPQSGTLKERLASMPQMLVDPLQPGGRGPVGHVHHRRPWYPGTAQKLAAFRKTFPEAQELGVPSPETEACDIPQTPALFMEGLAPGQAATRDESWGPCLQEVAIPGTGNDVAKFLTASSQFANDGCWGTLSCMVLCSPTSRASAGEAAYDAFISSLRFGAVAVNVVPAIAFIATALPWGAFNDGKNTNRDVGSGLGFVHNTHLYDHVQKGVIHGPWLHRPRPLWFMDHSNQAGVVKQAMSLIACGGASRGLPGVLGTLLALYYVNTAAGEAVMG
ncbi:hypothetical protein FOA52_009645 [Chlamydomonas sp. UWO 241]|nr:hypothetical protein FOA52_009645 [Chlamydomonas sp. UWO 241]